nr:adenylate/guanylate cyclase domain-containing protein [Treponema primitia]
MFFLLSLTPFFQQGENKVYDSFLRFRPKRERIDNVVFLDVDDLSVAHIGVFPWPRSIMADGLLRLKEYGADAAIFDIEYIDKSPTQVDEVYLRDGLRADYNRRFSQIGANVAELLNAVGAGYIPVKEAPAYIGDMMDLIADERDGLYRDTLAITRDNDEYLAQAAALFGKAWGTLNLQDEFPLTGEQAERRPLAEQRFSYPLTADEDVPVGNNIDILAAIPSFMSAVRGAGFTNVEIDSDGIRRRIFLTRKVGDHWYLQLAFAPLMEYLGYPSIELHPRKLIIKGAEAGDRVIPLDSAGAMLLDWPTASYRDSYSHISFLRFSLLTEYEAHIEQYLDALLFADRHLFPHIVENSGTLAAILNNANDERSRAVEGTDEASFAKYMVLRDQGLVQLEEFLDGAGDYLETETLGFLENPGGLDPEYIRQEAEYCQNLLEYLQTELKALEETRGYLRENLAGKLCIIGRVDTGTTDIGVNPFHGEYVNVGTHAVVLDTILSSSFITPLPSFWSILILFLLGPLVIISISNVTPGLRFLLGISADLLFFIFSFCLFYFKGIFLAPLNPALALITALVLRETLAYVGTEKEKKFIRSAFSRYLAPKVIEQIIADPSKLQLGGQKREMTAMFTDIRSFSTISEALGDPAMLVQLLNFYLTRMSNIVMEHQGTIDKYEGDAIIAFFGAPLELPNHAVMACRSAVEMKKAELAINRDAISEGLVTEAAIEALLKKGIITESGRSEPVFTRIGLNTGDMVVGNMGTPNKMDYTIMGDAVNLAARLEGVNKQYNTRGILISEYTRAQIGEEFLLRRLDRVRVVGKNEPIRLYEIVDMADAASAEDAKRVGLFNAALDFFENRDWAAADEGFQAVLEMAPLDGPGLIYRKRCAAFRKKTADDNWDGVFNLDEK